MTNIIGYTNVFISLVAFAVGCGLTMVTIEYFEGRKRKRNHDASTREKRESDF